MTRRRHRRARFARARRWRRRARKLALAELRAGDEIGVRGTHPDLAGHLATWCRQHGHQWRAPDPTIDGDVAGIIGT